jgi:ABC-type sugar transport system ATPase subunit
VTTANDTPLLSARGIVKKYGGVAALSGVDFTVRRGEVLALLGANGAGKSTFIKILAGLVQPDEGSIEWQGGSYTARNLSEAIHSGMGFMFQQLNVVEDLTVGQYLSLGRERARLGFIDRGHSAQLATDALRAVGVEISLRRSAATLSVAERELLEIARAVSLDAQLVIMDEPTASLGEHEVAQLFEVIDRLRSSGVSVVYVSHKLDEVLEICDRAIVFRDGTNAGETAVPGATKEALLTMMVGERPPAVPRQTRDASDEVVLECEGLNTAAGLESISLTLHKGEILGVYGLMGAGRTELLRALYGVDQIVGGSIRLNGKVHEPGTPRTAVRSGIGLVPEDRIREAMIGEASVADNMTLAAPGVVTSGPWFSRGKQKKVSTDAVRAIGIKVPSVDASIGALSGGSQQKVVFGRWLVANVDVLLLDDPTVGVDVAAKSDIYAIIRQATERGVSVIVCSSELEELMLLADRIAILHQKRLVDIVDPSASDAASVIRQAIVGSEVRFVEPEVSVHEDR